jgi:hypothetical protein
MKSYIFMQKNENVITIEKNNKACIGKYKSLGYKIIGRLLSFDRLEVWGITKK